MATSKTPAKTPAKKTSTPAKAGGAKTSKTPAAKKPAAAPRSPAAKAPKLKPAVPPDQRRNYIEVAAYFIAERHGFTPGRELADWAAAEAEIDRLLAEGLIRP